MANTNLNFNDGYQTIAINGDESRVLRINPTDINLINRLSSFEGELAKLRDNFKNIDTKRLDAIKASPTFEAISDLGKDLTSLDNAVRELIDNIIGEGTCEIVFGKSSVLSPGGNGKPVCVNFVEALSNYIAEEFKKHSEKANKIIAEYKLQAERAEGNK